MGRALEGLFASTPPPQRQPACQGCTPRVTVREPSDVSIETDSREAAHLAAQQLSIYTFDLEGNCDYLEEKQETGLREEL